MCDTFVILPPATADGSIIFGKNSDREPNEAQALEFHPGKRFPAGATVNCTYITVPQVPETLPVLISRPFWMWGAEMGANSAGVVIGNEAVFTRMPIDRKNGLTGMDLLRLALERSPDAPSAVELITKLLADHGQGGLCGYEDKKMAYHNSFLIADPREAWVLETAGPLWAARAVKKSYAISNGLTIGEAFDRSHPDLVATARKKGWLKRGATFNFAKCYSDWFYTTFSACRKRQSRSEELIDRYSGNINIQTAFHILRDHGKEPYNPGGHFLGNRICAHAANPIARNATQTTGSLVAHLTPETGTFWATGTAAPCTAFFKPIRIGKKTLPDIGPSPTGIFNPASLWWQHEVLHRTLLANLKNGLDIIRKSQLELESALLKKSAHMNSEDFFDLTTDAFRKSAELLPELINSARSATLPATGGWLYRKYWAANNRRAEITINR